MRYILFVFLVGCILGVQAQVKNESGTVPFLKITPDARSAGMGETGAAFADGAFAFFHNAAAGLFNERKSEIAYAYTPWMRDKVSGSALHTVGGYFKLGNKQGVFAGFRHFSYAAIDITDENGNVTDDFTPRDWALDVGYARKITKDLSMSLTFRYISSDMGKFDGADVAHACAFDLGLYYRHRATFLDSASWTVGLQLSNVGSRIKYVSTAYDLPGKVNLGSSLQMPFSQDHKLRCALDFAYQFLPSGSDAWGIAFGTEYLFLQHFALRGGYHWGDKDKGEKSFGTLGCGIAFYHLQGDFSWLLAGSDNVLRNTYRFTLGVDLGWLCRR